MGYYDYSHYFSTIITNQTTIITYLQVFLFVFTCYFLWKLLSSMIKGRW